MAVLFEKTKLLTDKQFHYCPGCNHGIIHRLVAEVIDEMNLNGKVIGVSKLARLLDCFSKRMQIQERMTAQIADFLEQELGAKGVYVVCEGVHFCMTSRGIKKQDASMITSAVRGVFRECAQARAEFLQLIK